MLDVQAWKCAYDKAALRAVGRLYTKITAAARHETRSLLGYFR